MGKTRWFAAWRQLGRRTLENWSHLGVDGNVAGVAERRSIFEPVEKLRDAAVDRAMDDSKQNYIHIRYIFMLRFLTFSLIM